MTASVLRAIRILLYATGIALLAWSGYVVVDARLFQQRENMAFDRALAPHLPGPGVPEDTETRGIVGRIEIPRLGLSEVVMEGSDAKTLRRAAGHMTETPLPGHSGNTAITGHRDTFFRPLRKIRRDDLIAVTTLQGHFVYRVVSTRIVSPRDVDVLDPGPTESLTLITCYPFYYVGAAPQRFIVRADRVSAMALAR
jgi:sortase A